jgi:hypothetical protein
MAALMPFTSAARKPNPDSATAQAKVFASFFKKKPLSFLPYFAAS